MAYSATSAVLDARVQDTRDRIEDYLLGQPGTKRRADTLEFHCPLHEDRKPSAWLREYSWGCWSCDPQDHRLVVLADHLGIAMPERDNNFDYTLEDYAAEKGFLVEDLIRWGVDEIEGKYGKVVAFRCQTPEGKHVRTQVRGRGGKQWWHEDGEHVYPYGLEKYARIKNNRTPVVLVEGCSDVHALWSMRVGAVGIPGASTWREAWADYFRHYRNLYVWREPGEAGEKFVAAVARDLPHARILSGSDVGAKDPAELRQKLGDSEALAKINEAMATASPCSLRPLKVVYDSIAGAPMDRLGEKLGARIEAIPTPFPLWNASCRGFGGQIGPALGWYVLMAGASGRGKSFLAMQVASHAAVNGVGVAFHSLEMGWEEVALRSLAQVSGADIYQLEPGPHFNPGAYKAAKALAEEKFAAGGGGILVNRRPLSKLEDILDSVRFHYEVNGCLLHVVDYLQLAWVGSAMGMGEQIIEVSHSLRELTKDLRVVTLGLSQFNRETSTNRTQPPTKEGMLGGSALENDSDMTLLLDHSRYIVNNEGWHSWLIEDKNRHGPMVQIPIAFSSRNLRIRQRSEAEITEEERR